MALSFPYPQTIRPARRAGQGCRSCVHKAYCTALYWMRRGPDGVALREEPITDTRIGTACGSWSDNPAAKITGTPTADDLAKNEEMETLGIASEANRCGLTDEATGSSRRP